MLCVVTAQATVSAYACNLLKTWLAQNEEETKQTQTHKIIFNFYIDYKANVDSGE